MQPPEDLAAGGHASHPSSTPGGAMGGAPFGGYKNSGFGRTGGADTILEYTQIKAVVFNADG
jgi:acyl-CoA reductase-like NAD-dependent aldehyde dehydrogenase